MRTGRGRGGSGCHQDRRHHCGADRGGAVQISERMGGDHAFLFGRRTYEDLLAHWNAAGGPFRDALNATPKCVASSNPRAELGWPNSTLLHGDVPAAVAEALKRWATAPDSAGVTAG